MNRQLLHDRHGRPVYLIGVNYWPCRHHYYGDTDTMRFSHAPAGMVRLCDIGLPVLVEEFGVSTALWSDDPLRRPSFPHLARAARMGTPL